jgi:hypothetical protein
VTFAFCRYESVGLVEKNKDGFREDLVKIMHASENDFMFDLFEGDGDDEHSGRAARKKPTLSVQFRDSLNALMKILGAANPYFVRCLKPNMEKEPNKFLDNIVHNQLKYATRNSCTRAQQCTNTRATHAQVHNGTHTRARVAHTHTQTHKHTHTHTHTHTRLSRQQVLWYA